ncbi:MAG: MBOAT family protein, partial [Xanthomonadales bacterium]|nr:MBOAT family protein [Xanthomonadales bacterium]
MLFNSHVFIFLFLPLAVAGFYIFHFLSRSQRLPMLWLLLMSLFFYGWWEPKYLLLLGVSISSNFAIGKAMIRSGRRKTWLVSGITFNLALLAWFKYSGFLLESAGRVMTLGFEIPDIVLPLAISFFTFQQIAWLVDLSRGAAKEPRFQDYALFVSFFPQLIAGPIVHHAEMMPQFADQKRFRQISINIAIGLSLFSLGLFKKVVLADQFALYATPVFNAAEMGESVSILEAWVATLSYTFQLYFDFSGYSDMALGIARMFGIVLPLNFFSPYKARNIREFWRRWHITLSRFLRDYLYIPLGGNRSGYVSVNIMITMLLGGLWHGAAWTFVAWGGLHGLMLLGHRAWTGLRGRQPRDGLASKVFGGLLTFFCVALAWVLFRSESFDAALSIYAALAGAGGMTLPASMEALAPLADA